MAHRHQDLFDAIPDGYNANVTGWLVYDGTKELPAPTPVDEFDPFDDFTLVPVDGQKLLPDADQTIELELTMENLGDGANYAAFNGITYVRPKVPTLFTALTTSLQWAFITDNRHLTPVSIQHSRCAFALQA